MKDSLNLKDTVTIHRSNTLEGLCDLMRRYAKGVKYVTWLVNEQSPGHFYLRVSLTNGQAKCHTTLWANDTAEPIISQLFTQFWNEVEICNKTA